MLDETKFEEFPTTIIAHKRIAVRWIPRSCKNADDRNRQPHEKIRRIDGP